MNALRLWCGGVCAAAIAAAVIGFLAPRGNLRHTLRTVLVLFTLCALLLPLGSIPFSELFSALEPENFGAAEDYSKRILGDFTKTAAENLRNLAEKTLIEKGIPYRKIEVAADIDAEGCIEIKQILLVSGDPESALLGEAALSETLGIPVEVTYEGEASQFS